jgi:hypothetical protein
MLQDCRCHFVGAVYAADEKARHKSIVGQVSVLGRVSHELVITFV